MPLICVWDTETTGLIEHSARPLNRQPRIVELCALLLDVRGDGTATEEGLFNELFSVPERLSPEITRVTGIKADDLAGKPPIAQRWRDVELFFGRAGTWVAHNASFDSAMMHLEAKRLGRPWPPNGMDAKLVCTVEQTEFLFSKRPRLSDLHAHLFGEPHTGAHRAEQDVRALARCYCELIKRGDMAL